LPSAAAHARRHVPCRDRAPAAGRGGVRAAAALGGLLLLLATAAHGQTVGPSIGSSIAPPPPADHAADRIYDAAVMAQARRQLGLEHGGGSYSALTANIFEHDLGGSGYRWDGQAWFGGDITRFVLKSEGEGSDRDGAGRAEVQALYSRAIGPYFDLQAGVRQDLRPSSRTY